jgi:1,5-anhydro-D-fructose reductase (1,5-anhydro-D-mannitol-forming)
MLRWGIVGCGDVCEVKSGPGLQRAAGSELVSVMRRDAGKAADFARRHGVPAWTADAGELIADPRVDAVYIATPPGTHERLALAVAAAGKPCYVEKPMARNHAECLRMNAAFAAAGLPLFVAYYRRALPRFRTCAELLPRLGTISTVHYRFSGAYPLGRDLAAELPWRVVAEHAGGGLFLDLGCHALDLLDHLLGPLEGVAGHAASRAGRLDVEDTVAMSFRTAAGALGTASWSFSTPERLDEVVIDGERGQLRFAVFGDAPITLIADGETSRHAGENPRHIQQPLIQTIVDQLAGRGVCPSNGESAARTQAVMDTVLAGYYGGRGDGFWRDPASWPGRRAP